MNLKLENPLAVVIMAGYSDKIRHGRPEVAQMSQHARLIRTVHFASILSQVLPHYEYYPKHSSTYMCPTLQKVLHPSVLVHTVWPACTVG